MDKERFINLQLFAAPEPAEDDDPNVVDEEPETTDGSDEEEEVDFSKLFDVEDEEESEETDAESQEEENTETETEGVKPEDAKTEVSTEGQDKVDTAEKPKEEEKEIRYFTQEDVDRIVQERLARDRKSKFVRELEELTGMQLEQIVELAKENRIRERAEQLGITEDEARQMIEKEDRLREMEEKLREYEERQKQMQEQQEAITRVIRYSNDKAKYLNNPLVKKYEKEIDNFAKGGLVLDFEPAMNYILGQKLLSGELLEDIKTGIEQKTIANITKRQKITIEKDGAGKAVDIGLTPEEKRLAKALGLTPDEYLEEKQKILKSKKR